jgi:hypothetical protein
LKTKVGGSTSGKCIDFFKECTINLSKCHHFQDNN